MTDLRLGTVIRFVRIRRGWRQRDLAERAGVSQSAVSRIERGHLAEVTLESIREVAGALDIRVDVVGRWRGADLDRLLAAGHSALHESAARYLGGMRGWQFASEVSFSKYADRGVIDLLARHEPTRSVLVIELKTEFIDMNELIGTIDRKFRNAAQIVRERGWLANAASVSVWVIVADSSTNRRRATEHATMLRHAYPLDDRAIRAWLRKPSGPVRCLSFWANSRPGTGAAGPRPLRPARHRVRLSSTHDATAAGRLGAPSNRGKAP